jgi:hypothetical protein
MMVRRVYDASRQELTLLREVVYHFLLRKEYHTLGVFVKGVPLQGLYAKNSLTHLAYPYATPR